MDVPCYAFLSRIRFNYTFHAQQPLPFVLSDPDSTGEGGFGFVCSASVLAGCHNYGLSEESEDTSSHDFKVALRCFKAADEAAKTFYNQEKKTLETMRNLRHPHLVQALAAYERGNDRGFVFPWANGGNLQQFWEKEKDRVVINDKVLSWALGQIRGIVEGITRLHGPHDQGACHGDIKPANIIIFKSGEDDLGTLTVADVGLAKFHATYTKNRATTTKRGSRRYEPPEVLQAGTSFSRKYDVWSLGCTFLEFLIWLMYGPQGLKVFFNRCREGVIDDRYWYNSSLRTIIWNWMDELSAKLPPRSACGDILDLIQTRLLIVEVDLRATSHELLEKLDEILDNYQRDSSYRSHSTLGRLTPSAHLLASAPATVMSRSISENRTSYIRDEWNNVTENILANRILKELERRSPWLYRESSSSLCSFCRTLDLSLPVIDLRRNIKEIRGSIHMCECCKLLNLCLSKTNILHTKPLQVYRKGSVLYASDAGQPIISIYSNREDYAGGQSYAQVGLPKLPEVASPQQFQLLKEWIRLCDEKHGCIRILGPTAASTRMPTRIIDVDSGNDTGLRLMVPSNTIMVPYVALSHCWGKIDRTRKFVTEKKNINDLMNQISFDLLPKTFRDAITTTRQLGFRYLWIDSLCIIQDDETDWLIEAKKMEDVYSNAYITIAASSATSSLEGFLLDRPNRAYTTVVTPDGPVYLAEAIDNFAEDVENSILNTRCWVLQERALSRRIIHFTSSQIYWECGDGIYCETLAQLRNPQSQFLGDPDFPRLGLDYFKDERISFIQYLYTLYCELKLSQERDRPVAISGLLNRLSRTFNMRVDYGIFWKYFERLMLWHARDPGSLSRIKYAGDQFVPSWSWMAYSGKIKYLKIPFGQVEWTGDLRNPVEAESQNKVCTSTIIARARKLTIDPPQLHERIILDADIMPDFNGGRWRCVTVGKGKFRKEGNAMPHYVILIRPSPASQSHGKYERIGVGSLSPAHFSTEAVEVEIM
ncbi:kinase-like domain-containing protein [Nemania sp. FL0916]|nr:kinase-like domain-containing protein [Nemania sp. FL0916]